MRWYGLRQRIASLPRRTCWVCNIRNMCKHTITYWCLIEMKSFTMTECVPSIRCLWVRKWCSLRPEYENIGNKQTNVNAITFFGENVRLELSFRLLSAHLHPITHRGIFVGNTSRFAEWLIITKWLHKTNRFGIERDYYLYRRTKTCAHSELNVVWFSDSNK